VSVPNPHDVFFKEVFSDKDNAVDFIKGVFPRELKEKLALSTLELDNNSYVDEELKESFSDIVYNCLYQGQEDIKITLLFEHKSYVPDYPHLQIIKYMLNIWTTQEKQKEKLTHIVPVVLYHGKEKWKNKRFIEYFPLKDKALSFYTPDINYLLIDLSNYHDEDIKAKIFTGVSLEITLLLMKNIYDKKKLRQTLESFLEIGRLFFKQEKGLRFLESVIRYIYNATEIESYEVIEAVKKISQKGGELAMTTAMKLMEKGRKEGIKEGIKEGESKVLLDWIKFLLETKFGRDKLKLMDKVKELQSIEELEHVKEMIIKAESLEGINL
jgi:predicted transposase/invertase (TIGR01784 family)